MAIESTMLALGTPAPAFALPEPASGATVSLEDLKGQRALDYIHPEDNERALRSWLEMLAVPGSRRQWRGRHIRRDGTWLWLEITNHNLLEGLDGGHVASEVSSLQKADKAKTLNYYLPPDPVQDAKNATGDGYHSDGKLLVVFLQ